MATGLSVGVERSFNCELTGVDCLHISVIQILYIENLSNDGF